jgi:hypothetical protein
MRSTGTNRIRDERFPRDLFQEGQGSRTGLRGATTMELHASLPSATATPPVNNAEADYSRAEEQSSRVSRWTSVLYWMVALATPVLLYFGPDVLSPTVPAIANAALDGRFTVHGHPACVAVAPNDARAATARTC